MCVSFIPGGFVLAWPSPLPRMPGLSVTPHLSLVDPSFMTQEILMLVEASWSWVSVPYHLLVLTDPGLIQ